MRVLRIGEQVERDRAAETERLVVLRDLVVLRHVRVEIVFPVELAPRRDLAAEHLAGEDRLHNRLLVRHRQHAGHPEAHRADMGIARAAELVLARAKHLRIRLELAVDFQSDHDFVISGGEGGGGGHKLVIYLKFVIPSLSRDQFSCGDGLLLSPDFDGITGFAKGRIFPEKTVRSGFVQAFHIAVARIGQLGDKLRQAHFREFSQSLVAPGGNGLQR